MRFSVAASVSGTRKRREAEESDERAGRSRRRPARHYSRSEYPLTRIPIRQVNGRPALLSMPDSWQRFSSRGPLDSAEKTGGGRETVRGTAGRMAD